MESEPPRNETATHHFAFVSQFEFKNVAYLTWRDAAGEVHKKVFERRVVIGSAPGVDILVDAPTVSRLHCELELRSDGLWCRDLHSKNGTFVDGIRIESAAIPPGRSLTVGGVEISIDHDTSPKKPTDEWEEDRFHSLVGGSSPMRELYAVLAQVAPTDSAVLIQGETGTGKEVVARSIHSASLRAAGPLVVVDCGALPENLLDAELFGHARGAFTGADRVREGAFETAQGGTIFLDEIGELPLSMQPKLLRVLEAHTVRRLGETQHRPVDVRFVSATHRDLARMVNEGAFREDLYFRLSVIPVHVPPLRDRREDIKALIANFTTGEQVSIPPALIAQLEMRTWRGNVRELRNFVERVRALGPRRAIELLEGNAQGPPTVNPPIPPPPESIRGGFGDEEPLTGTIQFKQPYRIFRDKWSERGDREYLQRLMLRNGNDVGAAATEAEVDRSYLYKLIRRTQ